MTASKNTNSESEVILRQAQDDISFDKLRMTFPLNKILIGRSYGAFVFFVCFPYYK
ncbi:MAG: hypothetical protein HPY57_04270 [Ignavibacteria bacterium]|nr:hypothetical protein [Ignavibacteria bacterium]